MRETLNYRITAEQLPNGLIQVWDSGAMWFVHYSYKPSARIADGSILMWEFGGVDAPKYRKVVRELLHKSI